MCTAIWIGYSLLLSLFVVFTPVVLIGEDLDRDSIDDMLEETLAKSFIPWIWYWSNESCHEPGVLLYHVRPFAPGGSIDTLSINYSVAYYNDCGINGHDFDLETFSITLYPALNSPSGYGVHSLTTYAHRGTICETSHTRYYSPPAPNLGEAADTIFTSWEEIWVTDDKHGFFLTEGDCDPGCFFSDECESELVMNDGELVPPEYGQFFHMYNIGEINDHLIENFTEINGDGGFTFDSREIWGRWWMDEHYYLTSPGPDLPIFFNISTFPYPNPIHKCQDNSLGIDTWFRSIIRAQIFDSPGGEMLRDEFLGEFCRDGSDIRFHLWDGYDSRGNCLDLGQKLVKITAYRGGDTYDLNVAMSIVAGPLDKPEDPSNLSLSLIDDHVLLSWIDNAYDEEWFFIERRRGSCAFTYLTYVPGNPGIGTVEYEDHDIIPNQTYSYRVFATNDGGHSRRTNNHMVTIPECTGTPYMIMSGPTLDGDSIYSTHVYAVEVETSDPNCAFTRYDWTVSANAFTEPGTIVGSGENVLYYAPDIDCDLENAPAFENKIDIITTYQGISDSSSTGWFFIYCPPPPDSTGCPYLYVWDGKDYVPENNLLPLSEITGASSVDYYQLRTRPALSEGGHLLEIREDARKHSFLDEIELLAVDHPPSVRIGVTQDGKIFEYRDIKPPESVIDSEGVNLLEVLKDTDGMAFHGRRRDDISLSFDPAGESVITMTIIPGPIKKSVGPVIILGTGGDRPDHQSPGVGLGLPRHQGGQQFFTLPSPGKSDLGLDLTLRWIDDNFVDQVGLIDNDLTFVEPLHLTLMEVIHSSAGIVTDQLLKSDNRFVELESGEKIRLFFKNPIQKERAERDFILVTRGYYVR